MKRRPDLTIAQFRKHWIDPHGVMTAELPGVNYYVQHHCIDHPATNALARELELDGFPELWFADYEARKIAYTSKRIAECNVDSEQFVGSVTRLVTEPVDVLKSPASAQLAKAYVVAVGTPDPAWAQAVQARLTAIPGVVGYRHQRIIEQAAAPNSKIPELKLKVAGIADVTFANDQALMAARDALAGTGPDASRTAVYVIEDLLFV
jgi:uncharacterized protein (TIGR02118 family)